MISVRYINQIRVVGFACLWTLFDFLAEMIIDMTLIGPVATAGLTNLEFEGSSPSLILTMFQMC